MVVKFWELLEGGTACDIWWLQNFHLLEQKVSVYDPFTKSIYHPQAYNVPWPIVWILARYNRKHIWASKKLPGADWIVQDIRQFVDAVKWRWVFRNSRTPKPSVYFKLHNPCNVPVDGAVQFWLDTLHAKLVAEAKRATNFAKHRSKCWSNMNPLVRWGLKLLKQSCWKVLLADKTGGYVLVHRDNLPAIHDMVLDKPMYKGFGSRQDFVQSYTFHNHCQEYYKIVKRIERYTQDGALGNQLRRSLKVDNPRLLSTLKVAVKTHKEQGAISVRNLHCSTCYAFRGLGLWIQRQLDYRLASVPFVVQSVHEVVPRLAANGACLDSNHFLVKFDIRDFFVCGDLADLATDAMGMFDDVDLKNRSIFHDALWLLLGSQYVHSPSTGVVAQVVQGSGMGLSQSAGIADAAFYCRAEKFHYASCRDSNVHALPR